MATKGADSSSRGAKRPSAGKRASRRGSAAVGSVVSRHRRDIWGLAAVVAGLLVAGSVWFSAAGPLGEGVDSALAACFGLVRMALPVGLAAMGAAALWGGRRGGAADRAGDGGDRAEGDPPAGRAQVERSDSAVRMVLGGVLLLVSSTGLLHLARGRPGLGDGVDELGAAGGALGVGIGGFLHAWTATWGSVLLLVFVGLVGVIVVTGLTVRSALAALAGALSPLWRLLRTAVVNLFSDIKEGPAGPAPPDSHPYGQPDAGSPGADDGSGRLDTDFEPSTPEIAPATFAEDSPEVPAGATGGKVRGAVASGKGRGQRSKWKLPKIEVLAATPSREIDKAEVAERGQLLQATLARFDVPTLLLEPVVGPTVTRFVLELDEGVRVSKLESLRKDIALAMASPDVRILSPIPGRRAIGVEVPNLDRQIVRLGDVLRSREAASADHPLEVAIGRDINGHAIMMNLATTPHLLIAGATGAGKSSCLNSLITSVLMRSTPEDVRMILVDPKRVEMGQYDRVPHLLTAPVTDPRKAANALSWAVREMERRYDLLHETSFRDIAGYNAAVDADTLEPPAGARDADGEPLRYQRLPFVLVVVDELADLMMVAARDVEESIARIAQMARAVGIHLVIATQRPSVNIITGVIKANIPARLAFAVSSLTDSRVILDQPGAERLVGQGDMLYLGPSSSTPHRIQGCWVTEDEVRSVVSHWVDQAPDSDDDPSVTAEGLTGGEPGGAVGQELAAPDLGGAPIMPTSITDAPPPPESDDGDELLEAAMALVVETQLGSTSMLQRRLRVGFARAGRIMDLLEQRGVVGPSTGSKAREVLITAEELESRQTR
ncbi:MAG: DNA translocase FtsK [Acidimicrobiaceae bacterium]|nr:DNA translocase FtsK [Acidimicrobiaceae bacterium]MYK77842.1 DNA translocase FtsK [Acidimicrobiaceae bacterium]